MIRRCVQAAAILLLPGIVTAECLSTISPSDRIKDVQAKLDCFASENRALAEQNASLRKSNSELTNNLAAQKTHIAVLEDKSKSLQSEPKKQPPLQESRVRPRLVFYVRKRGSTLEECLIRTRDWARAQNAKANDLSSAGWLSIEIGGNSIVVSCANPSGAVVAAGAGSTEIGLLIRSLWQALGE